MHLLHLIRASILDTTLAPTGGSGLRPNRVPPVRCTMQLTLALVLAMASSLFAQTFRGAINGTVTDPSGAVVANAQVKAINTETNRESTGTTTSEGQFLFQDLPVGTYKVMVTATGFPVYTADNVEITAGKIRSLDIKLAMTKQNEQVEVSADALTVDTTSSVNVDTFSGRNLQDIPLNGRDFTQLIAATPGYGGYAVGGSGSMNGTRVSQMNWQVDGTDNNDLWWNIPAINQGGVSGIAGVVMPIDAMEEFTVMTQGGSETGRSPGGTMNVVTKSGTNNWHGSAYYYNRNQALAASNPFLPAGTPKQPLQNYNTGGALGGPIVKNRTFFFIAFERQSFLIGTQSSAGNFGTTVTATQPSNAYVQEALAEMQKYGVAESPVSAALLAYLWPSYIQGLPAKPNNYFNNDPENGYSNNGVIRLDQIINQNNNLSFRWFGGQGNQIAPVGSTLLWYFEAAPLHVQNYSAAWNSILSPHLSNQFYAGYDYYKQNFNDYNNSFQVKNYGLYTSPSAPADGAPNINISGFDSIGLTPPKGRQDETLQFTDTLSYVHGKHQMRFGGEYRRAKLYEYYHSNGLGSFSFNGTQGPWANDSTVTDSNVLSLADFLAGNVYQSSITVGNPERHVTVNNFSLFGQDQWQVTSRLNLNLGLRYEYIGPVGNGDKNLSTFVPEKGGLVIQGAQISSLFPPDRLNFAPRVGFAYRMNDEGDLVLRGSFGIFYDTSLLQAFFNNGANNPSVAGIQSNPVGTSPVSGVSANAYTIVPSTYIFPAAGSLCPMGNCGSNIYNIYSVSQNFRTPYNYNMTLNLQKALNRYMIFQMGYVGTLGRKQLTLIDINQPGLSPYGPNVDPVVQQQSRPYFAAFPSFGTINQLESNSNSNYNSLQTTLKVQQVHGFSGQFAYTWAHALDQSPIYGLPQNSFDLAGDYGNGFWDTRQNFVGVVNYDFPSHASTLGWLRNGWQINSLLSFHTGQPLTIYASPDTTGTGENYQRANQVGDPTVGVSRSLVNGVFQWLNPAAFALPPNGTFGTSPRGGYYGPGFASVDVGVFKNTMIHERYNIQIRAEMFNIFNRLNAAPPSTTFAGPSANNGFGQSTTTIGDYNGAPGIGPGEPFNVQLAIKLIF